MNIDIECRYTVGLSDIKVGEMGVTERLVVKAYRRKLIWKDSVLKFVEKA